MSPITTHILDTSRGRPAEAVPVRLEQLHDRHWVEIGQGTTNGDGRVSDLLPAGTRVEPGTYRLRFEVETYFRGLETDAFYPFVEVVFHLRDPGQHYHVPLLLNPFGYSTYRGS